MNELEDFEYIKYKCGQDLHPVYGTVLDTFPNITGATVQGQTYMWDLLQKIKYNFGFEPYCCHFSKKSSHRTL